MENSGKIEIKKFNGHSFETWKLNMEDLSMDQDQWIVVDRGMTPTIMVEKYWVKLDQKVKITIHFFLLDSVLLNVSWESMVKDFRDKLGTLYQSKSLVRKLFL